MSELSKNINEKKLLTTKEACEYLDGLISQTTLEHYRSNKDPNGPVYIKHGRNVRYRIEDLDKFIENHLVNVSALRPLGRKVS